MTAVFWSYRPDIAVQFARDAGDSPMGMAVSMWRTFKAMNEMRPDEPAWDWSFAGARFLAADKHKPQAFPDRWVFDIQWEKLDG